MEKHKIIAISILIISNLMPYLIYQIATLKETKETSETFVKGIKL